MAFASSDGRWRVVQADDGQPALEVYRDGELVRRFRHPKQVQVFLRGHGLDLGDLAEETDDPDCE